MYNTRRDVERVSIWSDATCGVNHRQCLHTVDIEGEGEFVMAKTISEIESEAMQLSRQERAVLVERLLTTLDVGEDVDAEELWLQEAERRYQEYRAGRIASKPAARVFEDAKKRLL
jgi:putative addiction module component (TIGR02574 family)